MHGNIVYLSLLAVVFYVLNKLLENMGDLFSSLFRLKLYKSDEIGKFVLLASNIKVINMLWRKTISYLHRNEYLWITEQ